MSDEERAGFAAHAETDMIEPEDRLGELLDQLGGGQVTVSLSRVNEDGRRAYLPGSISLNQNDGVQEIVERISKMHGGGRFRLQLRERGVKGSRGEVELDIDGAPKSPQGEASPPATPAAAAPQVDQAALLRMQHDMFIELMRAQRETAPGAKDLSVGEIIELVKTRTPMSELAEMLKTIRSLEGGGSAADDGPEWAQSLSGVVEILGSAFARGMGGGLGGFSQRQPAPVRRVWRPTPAQATAAAAGAAHAAQEPQRPSQPPQEPQEPQPGSDVAQVLGVLLTAAARAEDPDPDSYARVIIDAAGPDFPGYVRSRAQGEIVGEIQALGVQLPADWLADLEDAIRDELEGGDDGDDPVAGAIKPEAASQPEAERSPEAQEAAA